MEDAEKHISRRFGEEAPLLFVNSSELSDLSYLDSRALERGFFLTNPKRLFAALCCFRKIYYFSALLANFSGLINGGEEAPLLFVNSPELSDLSYSDSLASVRSFFGLSPSKRYQLVCDLYPAQAAKGQRK